MWVWNSTENGGERIIRAGMSGGVGVGFQGRWVLVIGSL
jgi:hypothetical protein